MAVLTTAEQLQLFEPLAGGNGAKKMTNADLGLAKDAAPGPERLLRALVKRGLGAEHLPAAAALVLALDARKVNGQP